jgi:CRP-like cAMP-binding protein
MISRTNGKKTGNRLLDSLPQRELEDLRGCGEMVSMGPDQEICRQDGPLSYVHFPVSGIYATVVGFADGHVVEASTVGNEGMIGVGAVLGLDFSPKTATTPIPGECLRVPVVALRRLLQPGARLPAVLHRYAVFALRNAYQTVACNAVHSAEERMCRWLLTNQDRLGDGLLTLTHEFLAQLLGVRRQTVTEIAGSLQAAGMIQSGRGVVRILDRGGLESACCECYGVSRSLYRRIVQASLNGNGLAHN